MELIASRANSKLSPKLARRPSRCNASRANSTKECARNSLAPGAGSSTRTPAAINTASCAAARNLSDSDSPILTDTPALRARNWSITIARASSTDLPNTIASSAPSTSKSRNIAVISEVRLRSSSIAFANSSFVIPPSTGADFTSGVSVNFSFSSIPFCSSCVSILV